MKLCFPKYMRSVYLGHSETLAFVFEHLSACESIVGCNCYHKIHRHHLFAFENIFFLNIGPLLLFV